MRTSLNRIALAATLLAGLALAPAARAEPITYNIVNDPTDQSGWTLSGTITTDGNFGNLTTGDITSWTWTATNGGTTWMASSSESTAGLSITGDITASDTGLTISEPPGSQQNRLKLVGDYANGTPNLVWNRYGVNESGNSEFYCTDTSDNPLFYASDSTGLGSPTWTIATNPAAVPEPASVAMTAAGLALAGLVAYRRRAASMV